MRSTRGQILIPGLGGLIGFLLLFFGFVTWGIYEVRQMRLDSAAQAATLSAARAQAQLLNERATHNLMVNFFVNLRYEGFGAMQKSAERPFRNWLKFQEWRRNITDYQNGLLGFPVGVGKVVARLNGSDPYKSPYPKRMDLKIETKDLIVFFLNGYIPVGFDYFENMYFVRFWRQESRKVQPDHTTTWLVSHGKLTSTATARLYLDVKKEEPLQNGGFPRAEETWEGNFEFQSFYPQFNAKLIKTRPEGRILERLYRLGA